MQGPFAGPGSRRPRHLRDTKDNRRGYSTSARVQHVGWGARQPLNERVDVLTDSTDTRAKAQEFTLGQSSDRCAEGCCTACGTIEKHTADECTARRPPCHIHRCAKPTCIQARHHGHPPTCLVHFFESEAVTEADREKADASARSDYWRERAAHWQHECGVLADEIEWHNRKAAS